MQTPPSGRRLSIRIQLESSPPATCVCGCSNIPLSNFSIASCPPGRHLLAPAPSLFLCAAASFCFAIFVCRPPSLCRTLERRVTDTMCGHDDVGAPRRSTETIDLAATAPPESQSAADWPTIRTVRRCKSRAPFQTFQCSTTCRVQHGQWPCCARVLISVFGLCNPLDDGLLRLADQERIRQVIGYLCRWHNQIKRPIFLQFFHYSPHLPSNSIERNWLIVGADNFLRNPLVAAAGSHAGADKRFS